MEIDLPEVVAEVSLAFDLYEQALVTNDVATLDSIFRRDERTIRYGIAENLYGAKEVAAFRAARPPINLMRTRARTVITTYGRDFAVASTLFHRESLPGKVGRQMQSWVRFEDGWRVVAAHVSIIDAPKAYWRLSPKVGGAGGWADQHTRITMRNAWAVASSRTPLVDFAKDT